LGPPSHEAGEEVREASLDEVTRTLVLGLVPA
jgi:hypothetical protein